MSQKTNRRDFLKRSAAVGVGFWVAGRATWADDLASRSPNERIHVASIGIGGKGDSDSDEAAKHADLVAICDIDDQRLEKKAQKHPQARKFNDFRKMFDTMGREIDAVTISTPDHTHAVATMMAIKLGKAVYTQKPLAHDIWEARQLRLAAREYKVASQMGNQGTAHHRLREGVEVIRSGMIGPVKEVHVWTNRPIWPQSPAIRQRPPEAPVPAYVHWDEWLGTAPTRPYAGKYYHPFNWRGWWDFGTGALGDMGCHTTNLPFMALKLAHPISVHGVSEEPNPETYPGWARVAYEFPERQDMPPVKLTWYEGRKDGKLVQPPQELIDKVVAEYNKVLAGRGDDRVKDGKKVGLNRKRLHHRRRARHPLLPQRRRQRMGSAARPTISAITSSRRNRCRAIRWAATRRPWTRARRSNGSPPSRAVPPALSNFDYAGLLAEFILLGNVAIREQGRKLEWDGPNLKFPNAPDADKWLKRQYREPWSL